MSVWCERTSERLDSWLCWTIVPSSLSRPAENPPSAVLLLFFLLNTSHKKVLVNRLDNCCCGKKDVGISESVPCQKMLPRWKVNFKKRRFFFNISLGFLFLLFFLFFGVFFCFSLFVYVSSLFFILYFFGSTILVEFYRAIEFRCTHLTVFQNTKGGFHSHVIQTSMTESQCSEMRKLSRKNW